jgi:2-methylcitrate dehydratase PrpD
LKTAFPIIVEPKDLKYAPRSVVDAQFSMPFGAAVAILYGQATLDEYVQREVASEKVKELMDKVTCVEDPELDAVFPRKWPATVAIRTRGGEVYKADVEYPKGDPENALTWDELIGKFQTLSAPLFSQDRRDELVARVRALEEEKSITDFSRLFLSDVK